MESKFFRFLNVRRERTKSQTNRVEILDDSSRPSTPQWPLPISTPAHLQGTTAEYDAMSSQNAHFLRTVAYDTVPARKAPIFSSTPVKGNGPVKLQTSRRLDSGELQAHIQDNQTTLDGIREGDCVVGIKERRESRDRSRMSANLPPVPALASTPSLTESDSLSPRTPVSPWSSSPDESADRSYRSISRLAQEGLGILPDYLNSRISHASSVTSPSIHFVDEQSATVTALWKAEYGRLVELYGHDKVERTMPGLRNKFNQVDVFPMPPSKNQERTSEIVLDPLPYPGLEKFESRLRRSSNFSAASSSCRDDNSDVSSNKRSSLNSSWAASSSYTVNTNTTELEPSVQREEIRKAINEMRSTYLRALESQTPSLPKSNSSTKKKRRAKHGVLVTGRAGAPSPIPLERKTWHGNDSRVTETSSKQNSKTRATSHPPGFGRLSPVEASPPAQEKRPIARLQRADSTTLGSLMAKIRIETPTPSSQDTETPTHNLESTTIKSIDVTDVSKKTERNEAHPSILKQGDPDIHPSLIPPEGNFF